MTPVDLWAALAASIAASAIAMRARMLRPHSRAWTAAPWPVWAGLSALGLGLGMCAMTLWFGAPASPREAVVYSLLAATSCAMLWNLNRHGRQREADLQRLEFDRQRLREEVAVVMEAAGPPAVYPWGARIDRAMERDHG